jgi:hypothetical protein
MTITRASPSQAGGSIADATSPNTYVLPQPVSIGQMVSVNIASDGTGSFVAGDCTKSAGTATIGPFTLDKQQVNPSGQHTATWSALVTGAGSLTIAVATGGSFSVTGVQVYNGNWDGTRVEAVNGANGTTSTTPSSGNVTCAGPGLFVAVLGVGNSALVTLTEDGNFTSINASLDGTGHEVGEIIDRIVGSGTTDDANWVISAAPTTTATQVVVYREVPSAAGPVLLGQACL